MSTWSVTPAAQVASQAVLDLLRDTDPGAFGPHFQHPQSWTERPEPLPLPATRAARTLTQALQRRLVEYALRARGTGEAWEDIAEALDVRSDGRPDCVAAYLTVLGVRGDDPWWSPARGVVWTCTSCEEAVRDFGPECGGPDDRESGHAVTCSRHTADVLAWEALWA